MKLRIQGVKNPYIFDDDNQMYLATNGQFVSNGTQAIKNGASLYFKSLEEAEQMVKVKTEGNDFVWALAQMKNGKKVTLWSDMVYWYMKNGKIYNDFGVERNILEEYHFDATQKKGWRLVKEKFTINDMKVGDKFVFLMDENNQFGLQYQKIVGGYLRIKRSGKDCLEIFNSEGFENYEVRKIN